MQASDAQSLVGLHGDEGVAPAAAAPEGDFERRLGVSPSRLYAAVSDLQGARARIYWTDLLASCAIGYAAFIAPMWAALAAPVDACCLVVSGLAVYRVSLFTHELVHLPRRALPGFRSAWNVLVGVPLLVPSFLYEIHPTHHERRRYGSALDGEYRAFASAPPTEALLSVMASVLAAPCLVIRFLVLAPLSWAWPALRRWLLANASALVIDFGAPRALPARIPPRWTVQEGACVLYGWAVVGLVRSGFVPVEALGRAYVVFTLAIFLNALRVLCAHRYRSSGSSMTLAEQVLDSNNFPYGLAALWAPLGLRYHAVHHLFPGLPYHALGEAYRRVMARVPADSAFRSTCRRSLLEGIADVVGRSVRCEEPKHES